MTLVNWIILISLFAIQTVLSVILRRQLRSLGASRFASALALLIPVATVIAVAATLAYDLPIIMAALPSFLLAVMFVRQDLVIRVTGGPTALVRLARLASEIRAQCLTLERTSDIVVSARLERTIRASLRQMDEIADAETNDFVTEFGLLISHWLDGQPMAAEADRLARIDGLQAALRRSLLARGVDLSSVDVLDHPGARG